MRGRRHPRHATPPYFAAAASSSPARSSVARGTRPRTCRSRSFGERARGGGALGGELEQAVRGDPVAQPDVLLEVLVHKRCGVPDRVEDAESLPEGLFGVGEVVWRCPAGTTGDPALRPAVSSRSSPSHRLVRLQDISFRSRLRQNLVRHVRHVTVFVKRVLLPLPRFRVRGGARARLRLRRRVEVRGQTRARRRAACPAKPP